MTWEMISLPIMAALLGWGTNVIAIRMLFRPRYPVKILRWQFQGVLPKRKMDIARSIAEVLNDELLPTDEVLAAVNTAETRGKVASLITDQLTNKIQRYLPRFFLDHTQDKIRSHVEELVSKEIEQLFSQLGANFSAELQEKNFLGNLVEEKINSFDLIHLESLVLRLAKHELRYVELFGAIIGLVIGIMQVLFFHLLP